jgi:serine/threonine protein phosphatase 1
MAARTIAIGDIHGCSAALRVLLDALTPDSDDTVITLGDYVDRGPDSKGALDQLIGLSDRCRLVPLLGNHEEMLLASLASSRNLELWLRCGGVETVRSYGWAPGGQRRGLADLVPGRHQEFLFGCRPYHETETHLFMHAGYVPDLAMEDQPTEALRWRVTDASTSAPHRSGKVAIVGHTPQKSGKVLDLGFLKCIDTNCYRGGWLTALEVTSDQVWQADNQGRLRK